MTQAASIQSSTTAAFPDARIVAVEYRLPVDARTLAARCGVSPEDVGVHDEAIVTMRAPLVSDEFDGGAVNVRGFVTGHAVQLLELHAVSCEVRRIDGLEHVDLRTADEALLLSMTCSADEGRLRYVRSALPAMLDLPGGTYDPPEVRWLAREDAADPDAA